MDGKNRKNMYLTDIKTQNGFAWAGFYIIYANVIANIGNVVYCVNFNGHLLVCIFSNVNY